MAGIFLDEVFWFNTAYFAVMIASVVLYDFRGGAWMIPAAGLGDRARLQWSLARRLGDSVS